MSNNNLSELKEKVREIYDLIISLEMPEKKEEDFNEQRYSSLMERTEEIIAQNREIIALAKNILEKEPMVIKETIVENRVEAQESPKQETPVEPEARQEEVMPEVEKVEEPKVEQAPKVEVQQPVEEKIETPAQEEKAIEEEVEELKAELEEYIKEQEAEPVPEPEEAVVEEKKEEKPSQSSVLDFLHSRVLKDKTATSGLKELVNSEVAEKPAEEKEEEKPEVETPKQADLFTTPKETPKPKEQADLFSERPKSIADMFESKTRKSLSQSIGITYKFMFINDLFAGSAEKYAIFIKKLNDAETLESSMRIIAEMQQERKWAKTSNAYNELVAFVEKRFE